MSVSFNPDLACVNNDFRMSIDIEGASSFMAAHARPLDRRRFSLLLSDSDDDRAAVLAAVDGYRNADGGYGWGLEPDLRAPESQPGCALHALEAIADTACATPHAAGLLDWLQTATLPDGGLPFALPIANPVACAPFWVNADHGESSLQITTAVAGQAHRVARADEAVRDHPWLATASRYCLDAIAKLDEAPFAYVLMFALQFLDAASGTSSEARELISHLSRFVPPDGAIPVTGGSAGETLHLLQFAALPGRPVREILDPNAVAADLDRLERGQRPDGGWDVDYATFSPAAALEWRGHVTVTAIATLRANNRL